MKLQTGGSDGLFDEHRRTRALAPREVAEAAYGEDVPDGSPEPDPEAPDVLGRRAPDGSDEPSPEDVAEELGDEIATLAAHIHAATHRLLLLIARFDRLRGWEAGGHRSCAYWLSFRTGLDPGTAREHVRVARALESLPETGRAMSRGRLSFSQVRALTRVAEPDTESDLLELAEGSTTAQLERMVRAWKKGSRQDEAARERERHRSRKLSVFPDEGGMYVVKGRLEPEVGALLMRAVEAASDALYRKERRDGGEQEPARAAVDSPAPDTRREAAARRADAIGLLAERALAAGFGGGTESEAGKDEARAYAADAPEGADGRDEPGCGCGQPEIPISGTRAERYQVFLHVDAETLAADGEPGRSELEDGTRVSAPMKASLSRGRTSPCPPENGIGMGSLD